MWQKFAEETRRIIFFAQEEAWRRNCGDVDTEHLLLALLRASDCLACRILAGLGVDPDELCAAAEQNPLPEPQGTENMKLTDQARRAVDLADESAQEQAAGEIGSEHLLEGLAGEEEGQAGILLRQRSVIVAEVRRMASALKEN